MASCFQNLWCQDAILYSCLWAFASIFKKGTQGNTGDGSLCSPKKSSKVKKHRGWFDTTEKVWMDVTSCPQYGCPFPGNYKSKDLAL